MIGSLKLEENMAQILTKKTFSKTRLGYSPEEVDAYINSLLQHYHTVSNENEENKKKLMAALQKIRTLSEDGNSAADSPKQIPSVESEEESRRIIEQAQDEARRIIENAEKNAQGIVRSAQTEARNKAVMITAEARQSATDAEAYAKAQYESAEKIYQEIFSFRDKLFVMYSNHIEMIESIADKANTYFDTVSKAGDDISSVSANVMVDFAANIEEPSEEAEEIDELTVSAVVETEESETTDGLEEGIIGIPEDTVEDGPTDASAEDPIAFAEEFKDFAEEFAEITRIVEETDVSEGMDTEEFAEEPASDSSEDFFDYGEEFVEEPLFGEDEIRPQTDDFDSIEEIFAHKVNTPLSDENEDYSDFLELIANEESEEEEPEIRIDWSIRHTVKNEDEAEDFEFFDDPVVLEDESEENDDFHDLDQLFSKEIDDSDDYSLTDEFDIVYSSRSSTENVREIEKQPLVSPEAPSNPKKHKRF